jgi:hypothetical protein
MADTPRVRGPALPHYIKINEADGSANVTLQFPFEISGVKTATINMRRPKVRDRLNASKGRTDQAEVEVALFSFITNLAPDEIEDLDMSDYNRLQEAFRSFLSSGTSPKSDAQSSS